MKVILLTELKGKGGEGDVVDVADGYANNYLLPQKIAIRATKGNLKQLEQRKHNIAKREETRVAEAEALKKQLEDLSVNVLARVGEEGVLFGSVTAQMIADALKEAHDIEIDRRRIDLKTPIKVAGTHEVLVSIYRDIKTPLKIVVGSEEDFNAPVDEEVEVVEESEAVPAAEDAQQNEASEKEEAAE